MVHVSSFVFAVALALFVSLSLTCLLSVSYGHNTATNGDFRPVTCADFDKRAKQIDSDFFAHGHSKGVFRALLDGSIDVVVKRPIGAFLSSKFDEAVDAFTKELEKISYLGPHPGVARVYGGCVGDKVPPERLALIGDSLETWWRHIEGEQPWCVRVFTALSIVETLNFWTQKHAMHCGLDRGQFAFDEDGRAVLIDYGGFRIHEANDFPLFADLPCKVDSDCVFDCGKDSWRPAAGAPMLTEFSCGKHNHCAGVDQRFDMYIVCVGMFRPLLDPKQLRARGAAHAADIEEFLDGCALPDRNERWSIAKSHEWLIDFLKKNNGTSCLRENNKA